MGKQAISGGHLMYYRISVGLNFHHVTIPPHGSLLSEKDCHKTQSQPDAQCKSEKEWMTPAGFLHTKTPI